jgi:dTDP-4-dehydrorhamnose 3,5-epimerase-like enzyme
MVNDFYKIIEYKYFDSKNGTLVAFENNSLPFEIKRVLIIKDMKNADIRGGHTHHKTRQLLFAISGSCTVTIFDGKNKDTVRLDSFNKGILLEPYVWHTMENFESGTVLLVLADSIYNEKDYIRNYDDFLVFVEKQK